MANNYYGQGIDSTVRVRGDSEFCRLIHGVAVNECHLEGWPKRVEAEMELLGGCPVWQYQQGGDIKKCLQLEDNPTLMSCDHFGNTVDRDDPKTPNVFEGRPKECGKQRGEIGDPMAGFFVIAHGNGWVRACLPNGTGCGKWLRIDK